MLSRTDILKVECTVIILNWPGVEERDHDSDGSEIEHETFEETANEEKRNHVKHS